ncbi:hypothetical protein BMR1_01G01075 [Babesia microti strain RI]|uniref:Uncharacterized protein n=1 Tax=Babesia microti (strain RI) TaxID=1133968 RepID=I7IFC4_BABMR|nr:hypothetical protein BMR1_01G01075 [Babesia microti strain RI]CCF72681.1 hypothetical protein BMR1_01G01075 [Babesia microti strain RI]|eukprot:XP_012647290.1 hypothetical protein BMR1_01G01075 [Babesia microti strain RI]
MSKRLPPKRLDSSSLYESLVDSTLKKLWFNFVFIALGEEYKNPLNVTLNQSQVENAFKKLGIRMKTDTKLYLNNDMKYKFQDYGLEIKDSQGNVETWSHPKSKRCDKLDYNLFCKMFRKTKLKVAESGLIY